MALVSEIKRDRSSQKYSMDPSRALLPPAAASQMSIGLLGGSFNPPHTGHRHISELALRRLNLDNIWWLVSPGNPLKDTSKLKPLELRVESCRSIFRHPKLKVTAFESRLPGVYTVNTLRYLVQRYPGTQFVWLMGADNLIEFHKWRNWKALFKLMPIAIVDRPNYRYKAMASKAAQVFSNYHVSDQNLSSFTGLEPPVWTFLTIPLSGESSTKIRNRA